MQWLQVAVICLCNAAVIVCCHFQSRFDRKKGMDLITAIKNDMKVFHERLLCIQEIKNRD